MTQYSFLKLVSLPNIADPIQYLSVCSESQEWSSHFNNWSPHHYYRDAHFSQLPNLLQHLSTSSRFQLSAENDGNSLKYSSDLKNLDLSLNESAFFHNSYVSRYLKFSKQVPAKSSPQIETLYLASASLDANTKYHKDLSVLLRKVFETCSIVLISEDEVPFELAKVAPKFLKLQVAGHSDLKPLQASEISSDDSFDFYEYLCLLHMNSLPDMTNSHVQASSMYESPQCEAGDNKEITTPLWLHVAEELPPNILDFIVSTDGWTSIFVKTETSNLVVKRSAPLHYIWHIYI